MAQNQQSGSTRNKAVVAGALGVSGRAIVNHLVGLGAWDVVGLSRRRPDFPTPARFLAVDLLDRADVERHLDEFRGTTHVFFTALQMRPSPFEEVELNLALLRHIVEAVERSSDRLRKVVLMEGAKYYGAHLGPYKTPARENDPRHLPPNFYYDQEDYLRARSAGKGWSWTALRPSCICGFAVGNPMNMATVIAVYATLCRELGLPFRYPGTAGAYRAIMEMTDSQLLAKASVWAAENDRCDGEAFNITNGDFQRWESLWPRLAEFFGLECGTPLRLPLTQFMSDKEPLWRSIVAKHNLLDYSLGQAAAWPFAEAVFNIEYDVMSATTKARQFGFHEVVDTEAMLLRLMRDFQEMRFIPRG
ncbi:MAG TPA: SDR family oxidoreductase [Pirellulales bacterium]|nr:SDR family oxidoreductase [Pirellulales bacterium]